MKRLAGKLRYLIAKLLEKGDKDERA